VLIVPDAILAGDRFHGLHVLTELIRRTRKEARWSFSPTLHAQP